MVRIRENVSGVESGKPFGNRVVLGKPFSIGSKWAVVTSCGCGRIQVVNCDDLARGRRPMCKTCDVGRTKRDHGFASRGKKSKLYGVWAAMRNRCRNSNNAAYRNYGGRGVAVCAAWNEYPVFLEWAMSHGYSEGLEIDRENNDGNYEPGNCRWIVPQKNSRNKRTNAIIVAFGESKCLAEWVEDKRCVVSRPLLSHRIRNGWNPEMAISRPPNRKAVSA